MAAFVVALLIEWPLTTSLVGLLSGDGRIRAFWSFKSIEAIYLKNKKFFKTFDSPL